MNQLIWNSDSHGLVDVPGFKAAGVHCDVRGKADQRLDLALVFAESPCSLAAVFTRNRLAAAPVRLGREQLAGGGPVRGFVANSGNANACTGPAGMADARAMRAAAASRLGCQPEEILVCSTGRIGQRLPLQRIEAGVAAAAASLDDSPTAGLRAADAILTSDTRRKVCSVTVETSGGPVRVSGMAKGAGMIEPDMATMLAFIATDAAVQGADLQSLLAGGVKGTFNAITVDGDASTNDTVLLMANGASGVALAPGGADWDAFREGVGAVCLDLAKKIIGDGEKITKVVEVRIQGATTEAEAELAARAVGNSLLVKASWYGNDPNWGRLMDALGYSGAALSEDSLRLWYFAEDPAAAVPVYHKGEIFHANKVAWSAIVARPRFGIIADLGCGGARRRIWSTDLTEGYVNFNKSE
jgi:glutamate N-acetyltransferase / amino-acid N-acetyltransferase